MAECEIPPEPKKTVPLPLEVYDGVKMFPHEYEAVKKMDVFEDDLWVCSFPRSGTTLTQELAYLVRTLDFEEADKVHLDVRFPQPDYVDEELPYFGGLRMIEKLTRPRHIKSHRHFHQLPQPVKDGKCKIIYVARNPKDVLSSFYSLFVWLKQIPQEDEDAFNAFIDSFVDGTGPYGPWQKHVLSFWEVRDKPNILFLKYEDIVKDMEGTVRKMATFFNRQLNDEDVTKILHYCHVDTMRKRDTVNLSYWSKYKETNENHTYRFINKGQPGTWKNRLSMETSARVDGILKELDGSGLSFE